MKNPQLRFFTEFVLGLLLSAELSAHAATLTVLNLNDTGAGSLRAAISNSFSGDSIVFSNGLSGTIILTNGELLVTNSLNIVGPGAGLLSISGNYNNRVFTITNLGSAYLSGLTVCNGSIRASNDSDVALYCNGNNQQITIPATVGGSAIGGGILNYGTLSISNCVLANNLVSAGNGGGGSASLFCSVNSYGTVQANGTNGGSGVGGAIYNGSHGNLDLYACTFSNNAAHGGAGGVPGFVKRGGNGGLAAGGAVYNIGTVTARSCCFSSNSSLAGPGAIGGYTDNGNIPGGDGGDGADAWAGALEVTGLGRGFVTNCTFAGNRSVAGSGGDHGPPGGGNGGNGGWAHGAAVDNLSLTCMVFSCTICLNGVTAGTGGIGDTNTHLGLGPWARGLDGQATGGGVYGLCCGQIANTIVANNVVATYGTNIFAPDVDGGGSGGFNLISRTNGSSGWLDNDLVGSIAAPFNPLLGPLQDNGGPTFTMAPLNGSWAIDSGKSFGLTTDQRGFPRPLDFPMSFYDNIPGGDGSDIGAFELQYISIDIGIRAFNGVETNKLAAEYPPFSPLRISKNGTNYGISLVTTNSPDASKFRIQTASGIKAWQKLP